MPGKTVRRKRTGLEPIVFHTLNTLVMLVIIFVMLYPFWNTIAVSFNDSQDTLLGGLTFFPREFSLYNYETVFKNELLPIAAFNSVTRTVLAAVLGVFVSALAGYVLARREFLWRRSITSFFVVTMYVNAGLIPNYFLIKDLGMINTYWVYVIPGLVSVFNIIVVRSFMQSLPASIYEAAYIDGAGHFRTFIQIIMPCCKPILATVALWCAVGAWNSWFDTFIYASSKDSLTTLQYEMMKLLASAMNAATRRTDFYGTEMIQSVTPASMRAAVTVVAAVPILMVYPFLQKYFVKGVVIGSVKG
jgi:putative aldouronate transport system permease protein